MPRLSLDSLTLTDTTPMALIAAAAAAGFDTISMWVQEPALYPSPTCTAARLGDCLRLLADSQVAVETIEVFDLHSPGALDSYRPALERGARLGAVTALVLNYSNPDRAMSADLLARFAAMAREHGLGTNLEPVAGGKTHTLVQARDLILASGADVGITLDPHHLIRGGGSLADMAEIPAGMIRYVQLCDGPAVIAPELAPTEAIADRLYPGEGDFPLVEMLRLAPGDVTIGIECPSLTRVRAGRSPTEQAIEARAAMEAVLAKIA